jgi:hypothetical protein
VTKSVAVQVLGEKMNKDKLLELYPEYTSVLGPYKRADGRQHIVLNNSRASKGTKGKTKTISYPKALKEIELNRRLTDNETVDHNDRNFDNNDLGNLLVKDRSIHASEDALRVEVEEVSCIGCGKIFIPTKAQIDSRNKNKAGPFCSNVCSGRYGASVSRGGEKVNRDDIVKHYDRLEK